MDYKILLDMYITFMKIGGFTVGGGYAMIPIIQHEIVNNKKWLDESTMSDYITVSQSVPGVISINTATAVGYKVCGIAGAVSATLGMITPSVVIIILIAIAFGKLDEAIFVQYAFAGIRPAVVALIFTAVIALYKTSVKSVFGVLIFVITVCGILIFDVPPQYMIIIGAILSCSYNKIKRGGSNNAST